MNYILVPGPQGKSTWSKVNIASGLTGKMCSVMRRGLSVSPVCASLYAERSPNESFHSVILCDYRSGCPYRGNGREGERRRSEVTEVSLSSGCTVWSAECATMATLKRHICFCQSNTASHQVSPVCDTECEGTCMSFLCYHTARFDALKFGLCSLSVDRCDVSAWIPVFELE